MGTLPITPTPTFSQASVTGGFPTGLQSNDFFATGTTTDTYGDNILSFGFQAKTVIITNESNNDLVYQWTPLAMGGNSDSGIVKANSVMPVLFPYKSGIKLRSRVSTSTANYIVTAV